MIFATLWVWLCWCFFPDGYTVVWYAGTLVRFTPGPPSPFRNTISLMMLVCENFLWNVYFLKNFTALPILDFPLCDGALWISILLFYCKITSNLCPKSDDCSRNSYSIRNKFYWIIFKVQLPIPPIGSGFVNSNKKVSRAVLHWNSVMMLFSALC